MGYLASAMVNYLALLGWNDGSEDEIFTVDQISKFLPPICALFIIKSHSFLKKLISTNIHQVLLLDMDNPHPPGTEN
jgi:hypothetical protein